MPALVASAQIACPVATPSAVAMPPARPPSSALRIVIAVSGPGVTITRIEMPRNARNDSIIVSLRLDAGGAEQPTPLVDLGAQHRGEFRRRVGDGLEALGFE